MKNKYYFIKKTLDLLCTIQLQVERRNLLSILQLCKHINLLYVLLSDKVYLCTNNAWN